MSDRFSIPDASGTEPIEDIVARLKRDISNDCAGLFKKLRMANALSGSNDIRLRRFESRINRIIEAQSATYSIEELEKLKKECSLLSDEIGR